jgi:hypothetical protein
MKTGLVWLAAFAVLVAAPGGAQERRDTRAPTTTVAAPTYKPPLRGAPGGRIGGGTRGTGRESFLLTVLAPDHSGRTLSEQPTLYWFISNTTSLAVEVTVMDPRTTRPLLEAGLPGTTSPGVHRIRLADYGVRLDPGVPYWWFVTVIPDPNRRSRDILAGGTIERVTPPDGLATKLSEAGKTEHAALYAEAGLWYDSLAAISELIESAPNDAALRAQRVTLLAQVGLSRVSEHETGTSR